MLIDKLAFDRHYHPWGWWYLHPKTKQICVHASDSFPSHPLLFIMDFFGFKSLLGLHLCVLRIFFGGAYSIVIGVLFLVDWLQYFHNLGIRQTALLS